MYQFNGTLTVKKINGRNGEFSVGSIQSPIGEFKVKQPELDQYEQGSYEGRFTIANISARSSYFGTGALIFENLAELAEINIDIVDENAVIEQNIEPDPIETDNIATTEPSSLAKEKVVKETKSVEKTSDVDSNLLNSKQLDKFSSREGIKLDPAVGAERFRSQVKFLRKNHYFWNAKESVWQSKK